MKQDYPKQNDENHGQWCENCNSYSDHCDCIGCVECGTEGKVKVISTVRLPIHLPSSDTYLKKLFNKSKPK